MEETAARLRAKWKCDCDLRSGQGIGKNKRETERGGERLGLVFTFGNQFLV